jgi:hypothetical protein
MRFVPVALVCGAAATPAMAQIPVFPVTDLALAQQAVEPAKLDDLVAKLGAGDFRTREKAGAELLALGDRALPQLRYALTQTKDYEVSRRLGTIVKQFEADRLAAPRKVTLKGQRMPAKEALQQVARQAGYRFNLDQLDQNKEEAKCAFTFDLVDVPFWQAVDAVCNAAGIDVNVNDDAGTLMFSYSDCYNPVSSPPPPST